MVSVLTSVALGARLLVIIRANVTQDGEHSGQMLQFVR